MITPSCRNVGSWSPQVPVLHTVYDLVFHQNSSASGKMARHQLEEHLQHVRKCLTCFFINFLMHYVSLIGLLERGGFENWRFQRENPWRGPRSYRPRWLRWQGDTAVPPSSGCVSSTSRWPAAAAITFHSKQILHLTCNVIFRQKYYNQMWPIQYNMNSCCYSLSSYFLAFR